MAWGGSAMLREWNKGLLAKSATGYGGLTTDTLNVALYGVVTPNKDDSVGNTGYNTGQWVTAGEISDGTNWHAGGEPLTSPALSSPASGITQFTGANTPQAGTTTTLAGVFGALLYDNAITAGTVAKQGISYFDFGGSQTVTAGTFTIVWNANGLFRYAT